MYNVCIFHCTSKSIIILVVNKIIKEVVDMFENNLTTISGSNSQPKKLEGEYVMQNNEQLYKDIKSYFKCFIDTDETELSFLVLYATGTHYFKEYETYPILHITGDYETGKNRRLDVIEIFCYKPTILTNPSLSSLFRLIHENKGTILVDEADGVIVHQDFENALLAGYKKDGGKCYNADKKPQEYQNTKRFKNYLKQNN